MKHTALIIEDDIDIAHILSLTLQNGYTYND